MWRPWFVLSRLLFHNFFSFWISLGVALNSKEQGTSSPPWGRSTEYLLPPVTMQDIVPPRRKKSEHTLDNLRGKWPMIVSVFFTATAYQSWALCGSVTHSSTLQQLPPISLCIYDSLECSNLFQTPPCYINLVISKRSNAWAVKWCCPSANLLKIFLAHP